MHREWVKDLRKGGATSQGIVVALYNSEVSGSPSRRLSDRVKVDEKQVQPNTGADNDSGRSLNDDRSEAKVV